MSVSRLTIPASQLFEDYQDPQHYTGQTMRQSSTIHLMEDWDANTALTNLSMERALSELGSPQETAKRLFEEALPLATMAICHLATRSESEGIRFGAAKYVVERTMGPAEKLDKIEGRHVWDDIYDEVVDDLTEQAEGFANERNS